MEIVLFFCWDDACSVYLGNTAYSPFIANEKIKNQWQSKTVIGWLLIFQSQFCPGNACKKVNQKYEHIYISFIIFSFIIFMHDHKQLFMSGYNS